MSMNIDKAYSDAHDSLLIEKNDFTENHESDELIRRHAVSTDKLIKLKETIEETEEYGGQLESRHKFQHALLNKVTASFRSTYILLCYNSFTSAYQDIRFQYESFATLRGLNDDTENAGRKWDEYKVQAETVNGLLHVDPSTFPYDYVEYLSSRQDSGKDKMANQSQSFKEFYDGLSESAAHPYRLEGMYLDGEYEEDNILDITRLSLSLLYGVICEYEKALEDTLVPTQLENEFKTIKQVSIGGFGQEVPAFLDDYL